MTIMRAKMKLTKKEGFEGVENLTFSAVCKKDGYPADGSDEDNSFARFTPTAKLEMSLTNPDLIGKLTPGETYYLDFTLAEKSRI